MTYCAPLSSAVIRGWIPICPTMTLSRRASSERSGPAPVGLRAPARNSLMTISGSSSALITATFASLTPSSGKDLLGDIEHVVDVAVAAGHARAAKDDRSARLLPGLDHVTPVGLHRLALEIFGARAEVVGTGIHRSGVGDDGVDTSLQGRVERRLGVAVSESSADGHDAINELGMVSPVQFPRAWNEAPPLFRAPKNTTGSPPTNTASISACRRPI